MRPEKVLSFRSDAGVIQVLYDVNAIVVSCDNLLSSSISFVISYSDVKVFIL